MINVIHANDPRSFDLMLFADRNPMTSNYIEQQLTNFSQSLTDIGRKFVETSQAIYEKVNDSSAIRMAKAAIRMAKGMFHPNAIVQLETEQDLRAAYPIMQRYIMADETIRAKYLAQQIDGYSDTYANVDGKAIGREHYDWRRVNTGIVKDTVDENGEDSWTASQYYDDDRPGDIPLEFSEKIDILRSQDLARMFIEAGKDITDTYGR